MRCVKHKLFESKEMRMSRQLPEADDNPISKVANRKSGGSACKREHVITYCFQRPRKGITCNVKRKNGLPPNHTRRTTLSDELK